ncbi:MAG TPA: class I SAM-dependent methyltransferase [Candidatus Sulfopaludibacter sp.]|nr:class I SAM-dependent methyltransferase [Candidatus Sulfopaludibacter sp.]
MSDVEKYGDASKEWSQCDHALNYLTLADQIPYKKDGEQVLIDFIPHSAKRILDLGTGDGRLIKLLKTKLLKLDEAIGLDISPTMINMAKDSFKENPLVKIKEHDLSYPLPKNLGRFDVIVSGFAIHHLPHERKLTLFKEVFEMINPGGMFCNYDHVASSTIELHKQFLARTVYKKEDQSNKLLDTEIQLKWLRDIWFTDVDCYWKWLEFALMIGVKPVLE